MPANYTFNNHVKGDTLDAVEFQLKLDGVIQNLTGMEIACMFKLQPEDTEAELDLSSKEGGGIIFVDAVQGKFSIDPGVVDIAPGIYYYDMQFTFVTGEIKTFISGTLTVLQDVTYVSV